MSAMVVTAVESRTRPTSTGAAWSYAAAVLVGTVLIVVAAIRQPFSYDELTQIHVYGSDSIATITGATRQPPLDPLLGAMFQHLLGEGQLRQRLVPVLSGIGFLVVLAMLLRRRGLAHAGAFVVLLAGTTPLFLRYSAYTRPYALPMFLMMLVAYAAHRWIADRSYPWLVVAAVGSFVLPLVRVPEPTVFLAATAGVLAVFWLARRLRTVQAVPLIGVSIAAVLSMGLTQYFSLAEQSESFFDPSPSHLVDGFGDGVHELATSFVPLMADAFPWWPLTLAAVVAALVVRPSRRWLLGWPMWWALLAAPVGFAVAYHFFTMIPFDALPYRARAAFFFVPPFVLALAALAAAVEDVSVARWVRTGCAALLGAVLLGQLPATASVLVEDSAPDFGALSSYLTSEVPDDAIVLYDRPAPSEQSRQPFLGAPRYMGETPFVMSVVDVPSHIDDVPTSGPVYVVFNGQCATPGRCVPGQKNAVDADVPGWEIVHQRERFTVYASTGGADGTSGVAQAMEDFSDALGVDIGYAETYAAAAALREQGRDDEADALIERMFAEAPPGSEEQILDEARRYDLDPTP